METVGSLIDKITILNLKVYHIKEQIHSKRYDDKYIEECKERLKILNIQRKDLISELSTLFADIAMNKRKIKVFRQFKMYNDSKYKFPSKS